LFNFRFEEPKPEKCKICGKGFKNIPALNGHMRLHGGFYKKLVNRKQRKYFFLNAFIGFLTALNEIIN
jgi:hypothetical protein